MSDFRSNAGSEGIFNNDQGAYVNQPTKTIVNIPVVDLAYLSNLDNITESTSYDVAINLNPITLSWSDFVKLFFKPAGDAFFISSVNNNAYPISFYQQTYQSTQNSKIRFDLADQIMKAWSKKNNKSEGSIPSYYKIMLNRSGFLTKSLGSVKGTVMGLSLDEALSSLLSVNDIKKTNNNSFATVNFKVSYNDYYQPLNTSVLVIFNYTTHIPGYENVNQSGSIPYSECIKSVRSSSNICNIDNFDLESITDDVSECSEKSALHSIINDINNDNDNVSYGTGWHSNSHVSCANYSTDSDDGNLICK
jgi:hypothetical protein